MEPFVPGTLSGHGGRRIVPGRSQYRELPSGGRNLSVSGPNPQPSPMTSNSTVKTTAFCRRIGSVHQSPMWDSVLIPGVRDVTQAMPRA